MVKPAPPSILSVDLRVVGDLNGDGEVQIDGAVDGNIRAKSLLIGETAHIKGEIIADSVRVHGTVSGHIKARSVVLGATAYVVGDVCHEELAIETGAFLEGHCKRIAKPKDTVKLQDSNTSKINVVTEDSTKTQSTANQPKAGEPSAVPKSGALPATG
ncbi:MAG: polymer-forming cytoskeletal protein [Rhodospirillales bacterium]